MNRRNFLSGCIAAAVASTVKLPDLPDPEPVYEHETYGTAQWVDCQGVVHEGYESEEIGAMYARALAASMLQTKWMVAARVFEAKLFYGEYDGLPRQPADAPGASDPLRLQTFPPPSSAAYPV